MELEHISIHFENYILLLASEHFLKFYPTYASSFSWALNFKLESGRRYQIIPEFFPKKTDKTNKKSGMIR